MPMIMLVRLVAVSILSVICLENANAQFKDSWREGRWETGIQLAFSGSESLSGGNGESVDFDSDTGLGFTFGYNFDNHLAMRFEGTYLSPSYDATLVTEEGELIEIGHKADIFQGDVKGVYNFLTGPVTPFIQAGIGWTYIDSNVASSPPTTGCWWDPFFGYICAPFYSTYDDNNFSYSVGAGLRYELENGMFLRASADRTWIDGLGSAGTPSFDVLRLELGFMRW